MKYFGRQATAKTTVTQSVSCRIVHATLWGLARVGKCDAAATRSWQIATSSMGALVGIKPNSWNTDSGISVAWPNGDILAGLPCLLAGCVLEFQNFDTACFELYWEGQESWLIARCFWLETSLLIGSARGRFYNALQAFLATTCQLPFAHERCSLLVIQRICSDGHTFTAAVVMEKSQLVLCFTTYLEKASVRSALREN